MSRKSRDRKERGLDDASRGETKPEKKTLLTRRNMFKISIATLLGGGAYLSYKYTMKTGSPRTVFDQTNGNGSRDIECYRQIHSGPELVLFGRKQPQIIAHYINFHRRLFEKLMHDHTADLSTVYCLEGCNKFIQEELFKRPDHVARFRDSTRMLKKDPEKVIHFMQEVVRTQAIDTAFFALQSFEATMRFVAEHENDRQNIYGTEPDQSHFEMFADTLRNELSRLRALQKEGKLTQQELTDAAQHLNAKKSEEIVLRHEYMRDLLVKKVPSGGRARIVIGAGHFRSGYQKRKNPAGELEDDLLQMQDVRVRVTELPGFKELYEAVRGTFAETFTPEIVQRLLNQSGL